jgi:hypothetical protein
MISPPVSSTDARGCEGPAAGGLFGRWSLYRPTTPGDLESLGVVPSPRLSVSGFSDGMKKPGLFQSFAPLSFLPAQGPRLSRGVSLHDWPGLRSRPFSGLIS